MRDRKILQDASVDPMQFDTLLAAFQEPETLARNPSDMDKANTLANRVLPEIMQATDSDCVFHSLQKSIEGYPQPCLLVSENGQIVAINRQAYSAFDLEISDQIDHCGIEPDGTSTLSMRISQIINSVNDGNQTSFCRAYYQDAGRPITLAIVPHGSATTIPKSALVFFVDIGWNGAIGNFISRAYNLSISEQEILEEFILGHSLERIAEGRKRSIQTVRTQFYSALSKCGLSSQVDLVREVVVGSMFQSLVPKVANTAQHPHRRELQMLRPGGRTLEVVMSGDFSGTPMFLVATVGGQKFAPQKDRKMHEAGVCLYAISPPGYGYTSPAPEGIDRMDCFAEDVIFVQNQLNLIKAPFVAFASSLLPIVRLANRIPDRMSGILSFISIPPTRYQRKAGSTGPISVIAAMGNAAMISPPVKNLMTRSALRAWSILGTRKMAKIQSRSEPAIAPFLLEPETIHAIDEGFKSAIRQGFEQVIADSEEVHSDWYKDALDCTVPMTLVHGSKDQTTSIESVRDFANDFPEKITLIEIEAAGSFLHVTHEDLYIEHLMAFSRKCPPTH